MDFQIDPVDSQRRDYFAAHAPAEIPDWFKHEPPPKQYPGVLNFEELSPELRDMARWFSEDDDNEAAWEYAAEKFSEEEIKQAATFGRQLAANRRGYIEFSRENTIARFFQWRKYYAETLLRTLDNAPTQSRGPA